MTLQWDNSPLNVVVFVIGEIAAIAGLIATSIPSNVIIEVIGDSLHVGVRFGPWRISDSEIPVHHVRAIRVIANAEVAESIRPQRESLELPPDSPAWTDWEFVTVDISLDRLAIETIEKNYLISVDDAEDVAKELLEIVKPGSPGHEREEAGSYNELYFSPYKGGVANINYGIQATVTFIFYVLFFITLSAGDVSRLVNIFYVLFGLFVFAALVVLLTIGSGYKGLNIAPNGLLLIGRRPFNKNLEIPVDSIKDVDTITVKYGDYTNIPGWKVVTEFAQAKQQSHKVVRIHSSIKKLALVLPFPDQTATRIRQILGMENSETA